MPYLQTFRNRTVVAPAVVARYELAPRRNLVLMVRNVTADYTNPAAGSPNRNYNDTSVLVGIDYDGGGLWRYRLAVACEVRVFTSSALKSIQAPLVEARAIFTPTGLTR